ncbi:nuclease-related domain-containing protein [Metabacillus indicus]|uniref:nuclease-related domain-containing protein n=1 Tax=Metabacillus indicus TaxID=246786 RepID=UPI0031719FCD
MLILKERSESAELRTYRSLNARMDLARSDQKQCDYLESGYEGEKIFDGWVEHAGEGLILNDLLFVTGGSHYQMDSLYIAPQKIYLFEVKNMYGDHYIEKEEWISCGAKTEVKNPILQLKRCESLLRRQLQILKCSLPVEAYVVFVNPHFHLYHAPLHSPMIFPSQWDRFSQRLKNIRMQQNLHSELAEKLLSLHVEKSPYERRPDFRFEELRKGIVCGVCGRLGMEVIGVTNLICGKCKSSERFKTGLLRSLEEFRLLFPDKQVTTNQMYEWCGGLKDKRAIQRVLSENLHRIGYGPGSQFIEKE